MAISVTRIVVLLMGLFISSLLMAQTGHPSGLPSYRGYSMFPQVMGHDDNADWKITGLKYVSLEDSVNTALRVSGDGREFFPYFLDLILSNKATALEYDMANEGWHMGKVADIKKVLSDNGIKYSISNGKVSVDNIRSLAADINAYYILDGSYYDMAQGEIKHSVIAICPVMVRYNEHEEEMRFPLFWVMARDIEPYLNTWFVPMTNEKEYMSLAAWLSMGLYHESSPEDITNKEEK